MLSTSSTSVHDEAKMNPARVGRLRQEDKFKALPGQVGESLSQNKRIKMAGSVAQWWIYEHYL